MDRPEVFYTWEWAVSVQTAYQASLHPLLLLGYEEGGLVGVASLATDAVNKTVSFLAANTADYCDFLSPTENRPQFAEAIFAEVANANPNMIILANLPEDSATPSALQEAARKHSFHLFRRPAYACAQVELGSSEQRQEMKVALAGKKKIRRYLREMEREGPVTFAHLQSRDEIQAGLPA